jgi:phosphate transport system protein
MFIALPSGVHHRSWDDVTMRVKFQSDLDAIAGLLVEMADAVRTAIRRASVAILHADADQAAAVVADDDQVDAHYRQVEELIYDVIARQAPVASDLRLVLTALHIAGDLERMGDLADHVAKIALRRHPTSAVPEVLTGTVREMAKVADEMAGKISRVLSTPNLSRATELERDDDAMDDLHRRLLTTLLDPGWEHGVEAAVDMALLGRFYERYADHAVNAGQHVIYLLTGEPA